MKDNQNRNYLIYICDMFLEKSSRSQIYIADYNSQNMISYACNNNLKIPNYGNNRDSL